MFKISFSINNIQNTLRRHYRRGQTVLSLEQNVLEDRDEIKKKVFRENHQNNYNSLTRILLWSKDLFWSKVKIATFFFNWNSPKRKRCWTRPNQISSFVKKKKKIKALLEGRHGSKLYWKDNTGQTALSLTQISWKYLK